MDANTIKLFGSKGGTPVVCLLCNKVLDEKETKITRSCGIDLDVFCKSCGMKKLSERLKQPIDDDWLEKNVEWTRK